MISITICYEYVLEHDWLKKLHVMITEETLLHWEVILKYRMDTTEWMRL